MRFNRGGDMNKNTVNVENTELSLSNLDKIFWPEDKITKGELINYYHHTAPYLLPHLKDRPMTLNRYPNGIKGKNFYQKNCPDHAPKWVETTPVVLTEKTINFILAHNTPTLLWMVNLGCIEMHPWLSSYQSPQQPSIMVFDLDPNDGTGFPEVMQIAPLIKESLQKFGLNSYAKTSGSSGLHIYVPLQPKYTYSQVQRASGMLAKIIARVIPNLATTERTISKRGPRVYLDYLQNARGKTIASVYSVRPHPGAPVSFPVSWADIEKGRVHPSEYHLRNVPALLKKNGDIFSHILTEQQALDDILSTKLSP
jgi:bifunctional non-homologous end joining protein LigD